MTALVGHSGAGKTTIVHSLLEDIKSLSFSISACTRPPRKNEENGKLKLNGILKAHPPM